MTEIDFTKLLDQLALQAGGLIEIYVLGASYDDWLRAVDALREARFDVSFTELQTDTPVDFGPRIFDRECDIEYRLSIRVGDQLWTSSMYSIDVIDLQGDPRDVTEAEDLAEIIRLMRCLNHAVSKSVILVPETLEPASVQPYLIVS